MQRINIVVNVAVVKYSTAGFIGIIQSIVFFVKL